MEQTLLILLLCCIILIIILAVILNKRNKTLEKTVFEKHEIEVARKEELKNYFKEEWDREEKTLTDKFKVKTDGLDKEWQTRFKLHQSQLNNLDNEIKRFDEVLKEKEKRYEEVNQDLETYRKGKINEIDSAGAEYEKRKRLLIDASVTQYRKLKIDEANSQLEQKQFYINNLEEQINKVQNELEEERIKRAAINEELRKAEEKEKYNEIHSVQLTDNEKEDIHFLLSLEDRMHNKQILYKLVWSTYLQQAYKNTFHNILGSRDPKNVIYCIENINTGKKYIGKTSAEVSKRWTEHIKTSLNIGSIKSTNIHKALYNHWDEFIFYILIETEKEKLSEMEKYYINFYESDKYGYNIKAGG
mgnify:CR=1 FL=1